MPRVIRDLVEFDYDEWQKLISNRIVNILYFILYIYRRRLQCDKIQ